ncbi:MAG: polysaccharide biosynthesis C-terminal domain-containing protein [Defluviitaleaceae bacterium]|nr:polysaccharide biosynthesis C-terminal domain-containing protein [Defluviitaleaceae bacterium]
MRAKKAAFNSIANLIHEFAVIVSGLILPRLVLTHFGSGYNGVIASVGQFIGYISLLAAGVTGVTRAALYKPLAEKDTQKISGIMRATEIFMRKVAIFFLFILLGIAVFYPMLVGDDFDRLFVATLSLIMGIGTFVRYFFGITYNTLLSADQRKYVSTLCHTVTIFLNLACAAALILAGFEIRVIKFASSLVFAINPLFIYIYVKKRYKLIRNIEPDNVAINQRWDAFAQKLANFARSNIDIIILTAFLGIMEVSVYVVYFMIIRMVRVIVRSLAGAGMEAPFGNMIAKGEHKSLKKGLRVYEFILYSASAAMFVCTAILIVPFVMAYTTGVYDVDYYRPMFAIVACTAEFFNTARVPAQTLVGAAGHYKQTRNGAIVEVIINIIASLIFVHIFGLVGVAMGSLCALLFRTLQLHAYASKHIAKRSFWVFVQKISVAGLSALLIVLLVQLLPGMGTQSLFSWFLYALSVVGVAAVVTAIITFIFYRDVIVIIYGIIRKMVLKKRKPTKEGSV